MARKRPLRESKKELNYLRNNLPKGNAAQLMAINHVDGPAMVLAGPGSGKTFVIVERLRCLIEEHNVEPSSILVITFTKAAAFEMQHRFMKITDSSYPDVNFGTFHSCFYQIIRWANPKRKIDIATESFKYRLVSDILHSLSVTDSKIKAELDLGDDIVKDVISEISRIKNSGLSPDDCDRSFAFYSSFHLMIKKYSALMDEFNKIDFDDMILMCRDYLLKDELLLKRCREKYRFFLVDEYQDINKMQFEVLSMLCGDSNNLFVVGDDDQSIYGFRGSDPGLMLGFKEFFESRKFVPKIINLNINYRCGKKILDSSKLVIEQNTERFKKEIHADKESIEGKVLPLIYSTKEKECEAIKAFLLANMDELSEIAIICRTNAQCGQYAAFLKKNGIKTNLDDRKTAFYECEGVRVLLNYLSFAYLGQRREDYLKIINKPLRFITRETATKETVSEGDVLKFYAGNPKMQRTALMFFKQINMISHLRPGLAVRYLRKDIGIDKLYQKDMDKLDELEKIAREYGDVKKLLKELNALIDESFDNKKKNSKKSERAVNIITMHGSKGLEYKAVWIPSINEGIIPSRSALNKKQIEEERRMLYVAMTRAKQALIMSYLAGSKENPMLPSRFLRPIRSLWEENYSSSPSKPSSGSSTSSSNSTSSR